MPGQSALDEKSISPPKRFGILAAGGCVFLVVVLALSLVGGIWGRALVEKSLKLLIAPVGLIWLGLILQWVACVFQRNRLGAMFAAGLLVLLTFAGNDFVTHFLLNSLEAPFTQVDPFSDRRYDVLVVLGGGTDDRINGHPQLANSGERVALAAELFHAGQCERIVVTGSTTFKNSEADLDPCDEAAQILQELGVPTNRIEQIRGKNTREESLAFANWLKGRIGSKEFVPNRVGLVTSAWHMQRALGLFKRQSIPNLEPVPADFLAGSLPLDPAWVIPNAENLRNSSIGISEYLGRWIGR